MKKVFKFIWDILNTIFYVVFSTITFIVLFVIGYILGLIVSEIMILIGLLYNLYCICTLKGENKNTRKLLMYFFGIPFLFLPLFLLDVLTVFVGWRKNDDDEDFDYYEG